METKTCKDCKEEQDIENFSSAFNKQFPNLRKARCKPCHLKWANPYSKLYYRRFHPIKEKEIKTEKCCKDCKKVKSIEDFRLALNKNYPDLRQARCKSCHRTWVNLQPKYGYNKAYYRKKHPKKEKIIITEKCCTDCKTTKSIDEFYNNSTKLKTYRSRCIPCHKLKNNLISKLRMRKRVLNPELKAKIQKANREYQKRMRDQLSDTYMKKILVDNVFIISGLRPSYKDITEDMVKALRGKILITKQINQTNHEQINTPGH